MAHERRFDPAKLAKLDAPERRARMPWQAIRAAVDIQAGARVADVGAGTGYYTFALLDGAVQPALVHAIDASAPMLEELARRAREQGKELLLRIHVAAAEALPIDNGSVDHVILGNVFHELDDPVQALSEARRVLSPSGRVLIVDWERPDAAHGDPEIGPPYAHRTARREVEEALRTAGFLRVHLHPGFRDVYAITGEVP